MQEPVLQKKIASNMRKCISCGSNMVFDPQSQKLLCKHCGSTQNINLSTLAREIDIMSGFSMDDEWENEENDVFECDNCGAKVVLSRGETAKECPFCGTPHVAKITGLSGIKPNAIIPFTICKEKANELVSNWAKKGLFVSSKFKKSFKTKSLDGVYIPAFTFDSVTTSSYTGKIGITRYELYDGVAEFSDDTQMTLYTACGLLNAVKNDCDIVAVIHPNYDAFSQVYGDGYTVATVEKELASAVEYANSVVDSHKHIERFEIKESPFKRNRAGKIKRAIW